MSDQKKCDACDQILNENNELSFILTQYGYEDSHYDFCGFPCLVDYCTEHDKNYLHHGSQGRDKWVKTGKQHVPHEHQGEKWNGCRVCGWVSGHGLHSSDPKERKSMQKAVVRKYKEDVRNGKRNNNVR
jgi:hypothetical protein